MLSRATPSASSLTEHFIVPLTGWLGATAGKPTREISKRGNEWPLQRLLGNSSQIDAMTESVFASRLSLLPVFSAPIKIYLPGGDSAWVS